MKIRDLLAVESIDLNGKATGKTDVLNQCVDLWQKVEKLPMSKNIVKVYLRERMRELQV